MCFGGVGKKVKEMKKKENAAATATAAGGQKGKGNIGEFYFSRALLCLAVCGFDSIRGWACVILQSPFVLHQVCLAPPRNPTTSTDSVKQFANMF